MSITDKDDYRSLPFWQEFRWLYGLDFDEDQPRDEQGKWTSGSGGSVTSEKSQSSVEQTNDYVKRIKDTEKRRGYKAAVERGRALIGSAMLGREFGESAKAFEERKPELAEFAKWFDKYDTLPAPDW